MSFGRPLRGYIIHEAIGEGAFGRVYSATQPGTERRVAIKAIRPDLADCPRFHPPLRGRGAAGGPAGASAHRAVVRLLARARRGLSGVAPACVAARSACVGRARAAPGRADRVQLIARQVGAAVGCRTPARHGHHDVKASNVLLDDRRQRLSHRLRDRRRGPTRASVWAGLPRGDVRGVGWLLWELLTGAGSGTGLDGVVDRWPADVGQAVPSLVGQMPTVVPRGSRPCWPRPPIRWRGTTRSPSWCGAGGPRLVGPSGQLSPVSLRRATSGRLGPACGAALRLTAADRGRG